MCSGSILPDNGNNILTGMRIKRKIIAINEDTGERKEFDSEYALAKELNMSISAVQITRLRGTAAKGWKIFDTPDAIRKRIAILEEQIALLES